MIEVIPFINERNKALWEEISNSQLSISIAESQEPNYGCFCQKNTATIYVTPYPNPASFTHELLHVKFFKDGILAGGCLKRSIIEHPILKDYITQETIEVVSNCMEHVKMLPQFLAMGYANNEFIDDYNEKKINCLLFSYIKYQYKYGNWRWAFDRIIGTIIVMKADNNPFHNYEKYLNGFMKLAPELYTIVVDFWVAWLAYDIWEEDDLEIGKLKDFYEGISVFEKGITELIKVHNSLKR